jgi:hypothetical protein
MYLTFRCPRCGGENRTPPVAVGDTIACGGGDWRREVADVDLSADGSPRHCQVCGNHDLWRQKDFPQRLGLLCVAAGAVLSSVAWFYHRPLIALGLLMGFALADMALFLVMPDVLVCYRCRAKHHAAGPASGHAAFDHELGERYRQEELRLKDAQRARTV